MAKKSVANGSLVKKSVANGALAKVATPYKPTILLATIVGLASRSIDRPFCRLAELNLEEFNWLSA